MKKFKIFAVFGTVFFVMSVLLSLLFVWLFHTITNDSFAISAGMILPALALFIINVGKSYWKDTQGVQQKKAKKKEKKRYLTWWTFFVGLCLVLGLVIMCGLLIILYPLVMGIVVGIVFAACIAYKEAMKVLYMDYEQHVRDMSKSQ